MFTALMQKWSGAKIGLSRSYFSPSYVSSPSPSCDSSPSPKVTVAGGVRMPPRFVGSQASIHYPPIYIAVSA